MNGYSNAPFATFVFYSITWSSSLKVDSEVVSEVVNWK